MAAGGVFDRLRQPEYTGENRCLPCTGVNLVIAAVLTVAVGAGAVAAGATGPQAFAAGVAVFACAAGAVYLRGYLVPGTPWLTETYFPDWVLRWFDKDTTTTTVGPPGTADATGESAETADATGPGPGEEDVEATLQRLGAIEECVDSADLCLTGGFRSAWRERMADARAREMPRADLAGLLNADPDEVSVGDRGDAFEARIDGMLAGQWESRAALLADVTAAAALRERVADWESVPVADRGQLLEGLRIFLDRCPACDGPVALGEDVVESCCRSVDVVTVTCEDCGARLFEVEHPGQ